MLSVSQKSLIIIFVLLFSASSWFLFWKNETALDPQTLNDTWTLSFTAPQDETSLAFNIENHTKQNTFAYQASYTVTPDKIVSVSGSVVVAPGETKTITPDLIPSPGFRTSIVVNIGKEKKEIYRK